MTAADSPQAKLAFEAFNARFIRPSEVARTFVPPKAFFTLLENNHSVLAGPRGSGKTTLLKMLTLEALAVWGDRQRDRVLAELPFTGIFVGADVLWATQASSILHGVDAQTRGDDIRRLLFRVQVCLSCLDTLDFAMRLHTSSDQALAQHAISLSRDREQTLAEALSASWALSPSVSSLWGLRVALRAEIAQTEIYARHLQAKSPDAESAAPSSIGVSWLSAVQAFAEAVNVVTDQSRRWALLVDELEITFPRLRDELFAALRSTYQGMLIKLALFPVQDASREVFAENAPTSANDYRPIPLWYSSKEASYPFCTLLFDMLCQRHLGVNDFEPTDVLETSIFDSGRSQRKSKSSAYGPGGDVYRVFEQLEKKDPAFREYLVRRGVDIKKMDKMSEDEQAAKARKVLPIVAVRNQFLRTIPIVDSDIPTGYASRRLKSSSSTDVYTGAHSLFALSEGNPRAFINLIGPLLGHYQSYGRKGPVLRRDQATHIRTVIDRFEASINGTPYASCRDGKHVLDLVEMIGRYFEQSTLGDQFIADFPLSFIIDDRIDSETRDLVGRAVNLGAIVPVTRRQGDAVIRDMEKSEFRLSYIFSPKYRLPISQSGRRVSLHQIIQNGAPWNVVNPPVMYRREPGVYQLGFSFDD